MLVEAPSATSAELAADGLGRESSRRYASTLDRAGLLAPSFGEGDRLRRFRLTAFGERWLLAVARAQEPPDV